MEDTAKQEILEAIGTFAENVDRRFERLESDVSSLKTDVTALKTDMTALKTDMTALKSDMVGVKSQMVTKSYLDDKLSDFRSDMVSMFRKEDQKVNRLVTILADKQVISQTETKDVLSFRLFR